MKKYIVFLIVLCLTLMVNAQRFTSFSQDPTLTVNEMKEYLSSANKDRQKEADALLKEFTEYWTAGINPDAQEAFIGEANKLLKRKFRPFPQFESFIHAYMAFTASDFADELGLWNQFVEYHATHTQTQFPNKMKLYEIFFKKNYLNDDDNVRWIAMGYADKMGFDQEPYFDFKGN